jgi:uncharacterized protein YdiU (UPF0061 family)
MPGAVLTRVASSHLRVGTFQYFAAQGDIEGTRVLADYAIARHYPQAGQVTHPYRALLDGVVGRHANLVAQWMLLGFIHGVMNTDNTSISGETIDYGPCAFMEAYSPDTVFSSIDFQGRYAYGNQPRIALWNLARLAEALLPLIEHETGSEEAAIASATEALESFNPQFQKAHLSGLRRKLGLLTERDGDLALAQDLFERMAANRADFTLTFHRLGIAASGSEHDATVRELFLDPNAYDSWAIEWRRRLNEEQVSVHLRAATMRVANPLYIPRNHLVERALAAALEQNFQPFEELLEVVSSPYDPRPDMDRFASPARPEECVLQTFCGT